MAATLSTEETFFPGTGRNGHGEYRRNEPGPAPRKDVTAAGKAAQNSRVDAFLAAYQAAQQAYAAKQITTEEFCRRVDEARRAQEGAN